MKLSHVEISGFRGYREKVRIEFGSLFTVIDGRNGVGKSTVFDAVEFALTGALSKYDGHRADGETAADYLWWKGEGTPPSERFVEVGFVRDDGAAFVVRRTALGLDDQASFRRLRSELLVESEERDQALTQLCAASIIRDEFITALSLDQTEGDRYGFLRDALGASDAEKWAARANNIVLSAKSKRKQAESDVSRAQEELARATRRLDEARASAATDDALSKAIVGLRELLRSEVPIEALTGAARTVLAGLSRDAAALSDFASEVTILPDLRAKRDLLSMQLRDAELRQERAKEVLDSLRGQTEAMPSVLSSAAQLSHDVMTLVALGRQLHLHDGRCPLCFQAQSRESFEEGLAQAESRAQQLDRIAAEATKQRQQREAAQAEFESVTLGISALRGELAKIDTRVKQIEGKAKEFGLAGDPSKADLTERRESLKRAIEAGERDLRVVETLRLNEGLQRAVREEEEARQRLQKAQTLLGRSRRLHTDATAVYDAARRAASDTLDLRLDRVLPLMAELYQRLRPHPVWSDIELSIRGDVKRFLTLRVGERLNPQFLFSSGQRRATGLAFLLSVNLSIAWSRWRTVLLDDPVQHIDDFRSVHLAELLSQLAREGRQIVCAVEDSALAGLLCRRLLVDKQGTSRRVTLGWSPSGALSVRSSEAVAPLPYARLVADPGLRVDAAG